MTAQNSRNQSIAVSAFRLTIRAMCTLAILVLWMVWRELDHKWGLSAADAGLIGIVRGVLLGGALFWVFKKTSRPSDNRLSPAAVQEEIAFPTSEPRNLPNTPDLKPTIIPNHGKSLGPLEPSRPARQARATGFDYSLKVNVLRGRIADGLIQPQRVTARDAYGTNIRESYGDIDKETVRHLEIGKTWWLNSTIESKPELVVHLRNLANRPIHGILFELFTRPCSDREDAGRLIELLLTVPLAAGAECAIHSAINLPDDHPARTGPVRGIIVAAR